MKIAPTWRMPPFEDPDGGGRPPIKVSWNPSVPPMGCESICRNPKLELALSLGSLTAREKNKKDLGPKKRQTASTP